MEESYFRNLKSLLLNQNRIQDLPESIGKKYSNKNTVFVFITIQYQQRSSHKAAWKLCWFKGECHEIYDPRF
jgi:hypothetical protein